MRLVEIPVMPSMRGRVVRCQLSAEARGRFMVDPRFGYLQPREITRNDSKLDVLKQQNLTCHVGSSVVAVPGPRPLPACLHP